MGQSFQLFHQFCCPFLDAVKYFNILFKLCDIELHIICPFKSDLSINNFICLRHVYVLYGSKGLRDVTDIIYRTDIDINVIQ